jgi:hypothetical protein
VLNLQFQLTDSNLLSAVQAFSFFSARKTKARSARACGGGGGEGGEGGEIRENFRTISIRIGSFIRLDCTDSEENSEAVRMVFVIEELKGRGSQDAVQMLQAADASCTLLL